MDLQKLFSWSIALVSALAIAGGGVCLVNVARSDGRIDYCRVIYNNDSSVHLPVYIIEGHRNWRPDVRVAVATTADQAEAERKALCPP